MHQVAVLDDNEVWCLALKTTLSQHGFCVTTFTSARSFMEVAEKFDIALIDFSIPARSFQQQLDGCDVITQLKESLENPPLMILMSAYFTDEVLLAAYELCPSADAYFSKDLSSICIRKSNQEQITFTSSQPNFSRATELEPLITVMTDLLTTSSTVHLQENEQS